RPRTSASSSTTTTRRSALPAGSLACGSLTTSSLPLSYEKCPKQRETCRSPRTGEKGVDLGLEPGDVGRGRVLRARLQHDRDAAAGLEHGLAHLVERAGALAAHRVHDVAPSEAEPMQRAHVDLPVAHQHGGRALEQHDAGVAAPDGSGDDGVDAHEATRAEEPAG